MKKIKLGEISQPLDQDKTIIIFIKLIVIIRNLLIVRKNGIWDPNRIVIL